MRTISEPAVASSMHCRAVAATSAVSVLVMDWMTIGAPPPTCTRPTFTECVRSLWVTMTPRPGRLLADSSEEAPGQNASVNYIANRAAGGWGTGAGPEPFRRYPTEELAPHPPPRHFLQLFIPNSFKSSKLEMFILRELHTRFAQVQIYLANHLHRHKVSSAVTKPVLLLLPWSDPSRIHGLRYRDQVLQFPISRKCSKPWTRESLVLD